MNIDVLIVFLSGALFGFFVQWFIIALVITMRKIANKALEAKESK